MSDRSKRIPAGELTAYERWELPNLGSDAKKRAPAKAKQEEVKPLTAADLEQIRQQAYDEGFAQGKEEGHAVGLEAGKQAGHEQGLQEGREQGLREGQAHIKQTQQQLTRLMQCLSEPLREEQDKVQETMLNVTLAIARSVIRRELQLNSTVIGEVIHEALALLPRSSHGVVFRVNEADADYVRESLDAAESEAEVRVDNEVHAGGCLVDTTTQQYDFTIEKRFQKLVHQMLLRASSEGLARKSAPIAQTMEARADFHADVLYEAEDDPQVAEEAEALLASRSTVAEDADESNTSGAPASDTPAADSAPVTDDQTAEAEQAALDADPEQPESAAPVQTADAADADAGSGNSAAETDSSEQSAEDEQNKASSPDEDESEGRDDV